MKHGDRDHLNKVIYTEESKTSIHPSIIHTRLGSRGSAGAYLCSLWVKGRGESKAE